VLQRLGQHAGGLVFTGRNDGRLTALNSATGKRLWEFQTGAGMNSPVAIFEYEGTEYVVAYSAGSLFAATTHGDSVWLFSTKGDPRRERPTCHAVGIQLALNGQLAQASISERERFVVLGGRCAMFTMGRIAATRLVENAAERLPGDDCRRQRERRLERRAFAPSASPHRRSLRTRRCARLTAAGQHCWCASTRSLVNNATHHRCTQRSRFMDSSVERKNPLL
jgi:hypothetical protein